MSIKLDVTKRIEWLKKRMTINEQDEEYIRLQIMEAMMEVLEKGQSLPIDSVSGSLPTLTEVKAAMDKYSNNSDTRSDFGNGINWVLNYIIEKLKNK